jgi:hypothetical protein
MKKLLSIVCLLTLIVLAACSKSDSSSDPASGNPLEYNSLVAADTLIRVNDITTITANAAGDGLTYKWSASYGTFVGSGAAVQWTVCHKDKFTITCQVTDKYNHTASKSVIVTTHN